MSARDNHRLAPISDEFVRAMRLAFGPVKVDMVREGPVDLGNPTFANLGEPVICHGQLVDKQTVKRKAVVTHTPFRYTVR